MEIIILAGGLGTRLKSAVPELPKCLAPVNDKAFLSYLIKYLINNGATKIILSLGYKNDYFIKFLENEKFNINIELVIEEEALGTGGAVLNSMNLINNENFVVVNGDTFYNIDLLKLFKFHIDKESMCTIGLKPMKNIERYGTVEFTHNMEIIKFNEKIFYKEGYINGGTLILNKNIFNINPNSKTFSIEDVYIKFAIQNRKAFGLISDEYFIDIGIPDDYKRAQEELKKLNKIY
jgi:D-glycero-alpha-D-manno-heptose 1-phosphate guanylyltransferase